MSVVEKRSSPTVATRVSKVELVRPPGPDGSGAAETGRAAATASVVAAKAAYRKDSRLFKMFIPPLSHLPDQLLGTDGAAKDGCFRAVLRSLHTDPAVDARVGSSIPEMLDHVA